MVSPPGDSRWLGRLRRLWRLYKTQTYHWGHGTALVRNLTHFFRLFESDRRTWSSLRASGRIWRDRSVSAKALADQTLQLQARGDAFITVVQPQADITPDETEDTWSVWMVPPTLKRVEFGPRGDERTTVVFNGDTWWSWSASRGGRTNDGRVNFTHDAGPADALTDLTSLPASMRFELLSEGILLDRAILHLRGVPVPAHSIATRVKTERLLGSLGFGADEYLLALDGDGGLLLRSEARFGGKPFCIIEATELAINEQFGPEIFSVAVGSDQKFDNRPLKRRRRNGG
jgi:hypothetical protein